MTFFRNGRGLPILLLWGQCCRLRLPYAQQTSTGADSTLLEYIRDISILGRLELYLYPTISIGEAHFPPSHVPLYIQP